MSKIVIDKAQKVDLIAKRGDNFSITFDITNDENSLLEFNEDKISSQVFKDYLNQDSSSLLYSEYDNVNIYVNDKFQQEDVMLFTITTDDETPILAACSSQLDLAMFRSTLGLASGVSNSNLGMPYIDQYGFTFGNYYDSTIQNVFDKYLTREHYIKIKAVAKVLANYSNKNTSLELSNYNLNNINYYEQTGPFGGSHLQTSIHNSNEGLNGADMSQSTAEDKELWFYNIFTNQESLFPLGFVQNSLTNWNNYEPSTGNNYIFWGEITGTNPFTINFDASRFNLNKGSYKYTFRSLSGIKTNPHSSGVILNESAMGESEAFAFRSVKTLMYGKIKIN